MDISHPWVLGKWMSKNPNFNSNNHDNNNNKNNNNNKILRRGCCVKKYTRHEKKNHFGRGEGAGNIYSKKSGDI